VADEQGYVAMGGQVDQVAAALKERFEEGLPLASALGLGVHALEQQDADRHLEAGQLEVAVLDRARDHRLFRRLPAARVKQLLDEAGAGAASTEPPASDESESETEGGEGTPAE
jgi:proteasome alpha subunit